MRIPLALIAVTAAIPCSPGLLTAQSGSLPRLSVPAVTVLGIPATHLQVDLSAPPGSRYFVLLDVDGGPVRILGERIQLGLTPLLVTADTGVVPAWGTVRSSVPVRTSPALSGLAVHLQALVLNQAAPNGLFAASNGESTVALLPTAHHEERFDDVLAEGFTGTFDPAVQDRLQGGAVRVRTHRTADPAGFPFQQPLATPLNPQGSRLMVCYRATDVGATGEEELLTAIRWRLFGSALTADRFGQFELSAAHSHVVPDYSHDPFSALPRFPNSGLDPVFASNVKPGEQLRSLYAGAYDIRAGALRDNGYVDYPLTRSFTYNGVDSLLLDIKVPPSPAVGANGQVVRLMSVSSPQPNARVSASGGFGQAVDPYAVRNGTGDNAMYDYELEFTRVKTIAVSPWRVATLPAPDYQAPIAADVSPAGTSLTIEFRGADDASGANATAWSSNIDVADGRSHLQYRITFVGDAATGEVPSLDTLVIPYR